tara:strand:+ start:94 stop:537 length:444 start_codon:yes stop_codon:yes gene_type:complete
MSRSFTASLKDSAFNPQENGDCQVRSFYSEAATVLVAGQWVGIDPAGAAFGIGNSVKPLDSAALPMPVGVVLEAKSGGGWVEVLTRGVCAFALVPNGIAAGDVLIPSATAGVPAASAPAAGEIQLGYALVANGTGAPALAPCYVKCE